MSHYSGTVTFMADNAEFWFEYNGNVDVCIPQLYKNSEELAANWRNGEWKECSCGHDEEVMIRSDFRDEDYWDGKACRHCMCITE